MPRSFSICMKSDRERRASPLARTWPAIWIAPPYRRNFSVRVVLPASGCEMIAKVRRRAISGGRSGRLGVMSSMDAHIEARGRRCNTPVPRAAADGSARGGAAQDGGGVGVVEKFLAHLEVEMGARPVAGERIGQSLAQIVGQGRAGAGIDQQRFGGDAFGIDDLMLVEEQLEIV